MSKHDPDHPIAVGPVGGPEALLRGGMRMPPGKVVSHVYLVDDLPDGEWFVDAFPPSRDEEFVRQRHELFLRQATKRLQVWALSSGEGLVACPAHAEDRGVTLFFSAEALARQFSEQGGFNAEPQALSLAEFTDECLPEMIEEGRLIGTNWTADLVGIEVEPHHLLHALSKL
jgi:hypothetical protein